MKPWVLLFGSFLALALVVVLSILLWWNRESDKSWSLFFKMIVPIGAAVFLLVYELRSPLEDDIVDVPVIVIVDEQLNLANIGRPLLEVDSEHSDYYRYLLFANPGTARTENLPNDPNDAFEMRRQYTLDVLEKALWQWLVERYHDNWLIEREFFRGIGGGGGGMRQAADAEKKPRLYGPDELWPLLKSNQLFTEKKHLGRLAIPSGSTLEVKRDRGRIQIIVKNVNVSFKIDMQVRGGGAMAKFGFISKLVHDVSPPERAWETSHINVRFCAHYNKWLRWSPLTLMQKRWVSSMSEMYRQDFEWKGIREDLERYIRLKATS
ncbi:MAG: hypothetical protein WA104_05405 [Thermodesulfovibrionales bacterium]